VITRLRSSSANGSAGAGPSCVVNGDRRGRRAVYGIGRGDSSADAGSRTRPAGAARGRGSASGATLRRMRRSSHSLTGSKAAPGAARPNGRRRSARRTLGASGASGGRARSRSPRPSGLPWVTDVGVASQSTQQTDTERPACPPICHVSCNRRARLGISSIDRGACGGGACLRVLHCANRTMFPRSGSHEPWKAEPSLTRRAQLLCLCSAMSAEYTWSLRSIATKPSRRRRRRSSRATRPGPTRPPGRPEAVGGERACTRISPST
jgi:hypothetical protein